MLRGIWQATATTVAMIVGSALPAAAAAEPVKHFPPEGVLVSGAVTSAGPAFSGAVMAGNTL